MANSLKEVSIIGLRATHFEQLMAYIYDREREGYYYGNKEQFYKRHYEIKEWLENIIKQANDPNNRIPKK